MVTTDFSQMFHSGCSVLNQMPICDSRACCGQPTERWPNTAQGGCILCYTCRDAANTDAAQETLFDKSSWIAVCPSSKRYYVTLRQHQGPQIVSFLLSKAGLAQCDSEKVLLGVLTKIQGLVPGYNCLLFW
ncbi:TPA: hypothetical protein ACH3X2_010550 [Trebouxia sp. C0005]